MNLAETIDAVHSVLRGEVEPAEAARRLGVPPERLEIYRTFVEEHVRTALEKNHGALAATLGPEVFGDLASRYFRECPARSFELNDAAAGFREFLADARAAGAAGITEFHLELAEVEWQEWRAYSRADEEPGERRPAVNPTLRILELEWPVAEYLQEAREPGREAPPPPPNEPSPGRVFVYREPECHLAVTRRADDGLLFALKVAHDGMTPEAAAAASGLPAGKVRELLDRANEAGILLA